MLTHVYGDVSPWAVLGQIGTRPLEETDASRPSLLLFTRLPAHQYGTRFVPGSIQLKRVVMIVRLQTSIIMGLFLRAREQTLATLS